MAKAGLLFVGTSDGLFLFSNPNEIGRWLKIGQPFRGHAVAAVWALPHDPLVVFAAVVGMGVQQSADGGQSWRQLFAWDADLIAGPAALQLYLRAGAALYASEDAGTTWDARAMMAAPGPLAHAGSWLYAAAGEQVLCSQDAGRSWARYGATLPAAVTGLAAPPQQPGLVLAVAGGGLFACSAAEAGWQRRTSAPAAAGPIVALAGQSAALLLACAGGGLARSDDSGASWSVIGLAGVLTALAPASYHIDVVFAGSAGGQLVLSSDRGREWQVLKHDLPPILSISAARLV